VGYVQGGDIVARVLMPGQAKAVCDTWRAAYLPTLPGHHKYKAQGDVYSATVDALEKELPPEELRARTRTLSVLASVDAMQQPIQNQVRLMVRDLHGRRHEHGIGQLAAFDIHAGWVELRLPIRHRDAYPADFPIDKQQGDYTLARFQEGSWSYVSRFYGRNNVWKGDYASLTTPLAIFADQVHVVDVQVAVWRTPQHAPVLSGLETLQQLQQQGVVTAALLAKIQAEGAQLLQEWQQAATEEGQTP
jgi:probable ribonuclease FAU-1